jgi:tartrate-resistant acid phosphatase type 5
MQPVPWRLGAVLGALVLGLALGLPPGASGDTTPDPLVLLPAALQDQGRGLLGERDEGRRVERVRELAQSPGTAAFLVTLLEREPAAGVRLRIVNSLAADPSDSVRAALERTARADADAGVALRALEHLHRRNTVHLVELLEARMGAGSADAQTTARLQSAHEHWLTVAEGSFFPAFMRQPPPLFAVAPVEDRSLRVVAFGDFGKAAEPFQRQVADAIARYHERDKLDFGLTLGDNFYPRGMLSPRDPRWKPLWSEMYDRLGLVFYATLGNHDWADPDSPAAEVMFSAQSKSWQLPASRYTFTAGPAQFFALDTQLPSAAQLAWLDAELAKSRARWKIVYGHHPIRSVGIHGDSKAMLEKLLPVLADRAQIYLAGHDHDMQHLAAERGVHFFVAGSGGAGVRPVKAEPRALFARAAHGFAVLDIAPERVRVDFVGTDLQVLHSYTVQ